MSYCGIQAPHPATKQISHFAVFLQITCRDLETFLEKCYAPVSSSFWRSCNAARGRTTSTCSTPRCTMILRVCQVDVAATLDFRWPFTQARGSPCCSLEPPEPTPASCRWWPNQEWSSSARWTAYVRSGRSIRPGTARVLGRDWSISWKTTLGSARLSS